MHYPTQSLKRTAATFGFAGLLVGGGAGIAGATAQGGDGPGHGQDVACGKVTSVGPAGFTLQGRDGRSETIDTNSSTTYAEPGPGTAPTGVAVGDQVFVKLVPSSSPASGTPTASAVAIEPDWAAAYVKPDGSDRVGGTVASLTSTTVVVDAGGGTRSVLVSPSTVIRQGGQTIGEPSITTGEQIVAVGHP
ncbi:MAG TPA: DUF5666 domain-containing protein, partial [Acidimicrobiales bacterium]|nr:DUF5666 domain-containing protein [Acidimicrobiales bacterium]